MKSQKVNSRSQSQLGNQMIWLPYFDSPDFLRVHHSLLLQDYQTPRSGATLWPGKFAGLA
jgi:hypothetical protein